MSSPLEGRIRAVAREEAAAVLADAAPASQGPDRVAVLEEQVADLRGAVKALSARLDAIERTAGQTDREMQPAVRRARKTAAE